MTPCRVDLRGRAFGHRARRAETVSYQVVRPLIDTGSLPPAIVDSRTATEPEPTGAC